MRPVIDLSILNTYLVIPDFKMEINRSTRASILPGVWSTSLDLADAYFHGFQEIPSLRVGQQRFSVSSSPIRVSHRSFGLHQTFSSCLSSSALFIQIHSYLDDSLVKELNSDILLSHTQTAIDLLLELGFMISWKKSEVIPSQDFVFLGEHFRTDLGLAFPPERNFWLFVSLF
jgi:hypothetical protein